MNFNITKDDFIIDEKIIEISLQFSPIEITKENLVSYHLASVDNGYKFNIKTDEAISQYYKPRPTPFSSKETNETITVQNLNELEMLLKRAYPKYIILNNSKYVRYAYKLGTEKDNNCSIYYAAANSQLLPCKYECDAFLEFIRFNAKSLQLDQAYTCYVFNDKVPDGYYFSNVSPRYIYEYFKMDNLDIPFKCSVTSHDKNFLQEMLSNKNICLDNLKNLDYIQDFLNKLYK